MAACSWDVCNWRLPARVCKDGTAQISPRLRYASELRRDLFKGWLVIDGARRNQTLLPVPLPRMIRNSFFTTEPRGVCRGEFTRLRVAAVRRACITVSPAPVMSSAQPRFKLAMCTGYNSDACCLPIHQSEIQDSYTHLVDVAHRCIETLSQEYPALRQYFCMYCNPNMLSYFSCCHDWEWEKLDGHDNRVRARARLHVTVSPPPCCTTRSCT